MYWKQLVEQQQQVLTNQATTQAFKMAKARYILAKQEDNEGEIEYYRKKMNEIMGIEEEANLVAGVNQHHSQSNYSKNFNPSLIRTSTTEEDISLLSRTSNVVIKDMNKMCSQLTNLQTRLTGSPVPYWEL